LCAAVLVGQAGPALRPALAAAGALWLCAGAWWGLRALTGEAYPGVILAAEAEVRSGPGLRNPVSFKAPEGRRVSILGEKDGWLEIGVLKEGLKGWLPAGQVEPI
ncbi:MAG: SH3 domain-containing protein, partial [Elusimicrobiota bacterium]